MAEPRLDGRGAGGAAPSTAEAFGRLSSVALPPNAFVVRSVPQIALLPRVDAVIGHGGNNPTNETLAAGKPLLVLPAGGEQGDNVSRVVRLGAGLRAGLGTAGSDEIRAKVDRLLGEPEFGRRARQIAEAVARTDGPGTAVRLLGQLALSRAPVLRSPGARLTVARDAPV